MKTIRRFTIKEEFLTSVPDNKPIKLVLDTGEVLEGNSYGCIDHPKFTKLRDRLEKLGFIKTERSYWNGDKVLRPFKLNGMTFETDAQFCCASALGIKFQVKRKI